MSGVRKVTIRELSRTTRAVIDDVVHKRQTALILHYGQPVALLTPITGTRDR